MSTKTITWVVVGILIVLSAIFLGSLGSIPTPDIKTSSDVNAVIPAPTDYVVDESGVLTDTQKADIRALLDVTDNQGDIQVGVLVVKTTAPLTIEEYGIRVGEAWKVGFSEQDNGAIVILATEDRKVRIEVGYGLEGIITDAKAGDIIDEFMIPSLKKGDWAEAITNGVKAIQAYNTERTQ